MSRTAPTLSTATTRIRALAPVTPTDVGEGMTVTSAQIQVVAEWQPTSFFAHGWHSFSATGWVDPQRRRPAVAVPALRMTADDPAFVAAEHPGGAAVGALRDAAGQVTLLGAVGLDARVEVVDGALVGTTTDGTERTWFVATGTEDVVFRSYARRLGAVLGSRTAPAPRMWASWYSFYEDIDEPSLHAVLAEVRDWPVEVFQVDDGWQRTVGDWRANDGFPAGMSDLAARIDAAGMTPGLWLAPFILLPDAPLVRERPDWLVRTADGDPAPVGFNWGAWYYALDLSRDDVLNHVAALIAAVCGWGYRFLKLDFLFGGAIPGVRAEEQPREQLYRRAVERIRAAAGEDTYLLACGAPIVPSIGIFDAIRVSNDVAPFWDNPVLTRVVGADAEVATRGAIATTLNRLWLQEVIATDPDVVFFRSRRNLMDDAERRVLQDVACLAGFRATSDPPAWLDDDEREELLAWFGTEPTCEVLGAQRYRLDGRELDLAALAQRPWPVGMSEGPGHRAQYPSSPKEG